MQSIPPSGVEATFLIITTGLTLLLFVVAFLAHKTAESQEKMKRAMKAASTACLTLGGLFMALTLLELVFRVAVPGGYFKLQPQEAHSSEAIVESLDNEQAYWEYRDAREFDDKGYRGKYETPDPDALKMVVLGDSVTYGVYIPYEDTFVYLLTKELEKLCGPVNLYNLAVPGYSTLQERIALERKGIVVKPDIVFLGVFPNDLAQYTVIGSAAYDIRVKEQDGVPVFSLLPLPDVLNRFLVLNSVFYQFITLRGVAAYDKATGREMSQLNSSLAELETIRALCDKSDAKLVLALFPMLERDLNEPELKSTAFYYGRIRKWAKERDVSVVEMRSGLAPYPLDEIKVDECCHYSAYGHGVVTGLLLEQFKELNVLPESCGK